MPPDHLTVQRDKVANAARAVLAGGDLRAAAASAGIDSADLEDAADAYHAAGIAALEHRDDSRWFYVRVGFSDWNLSEHAMATVVGPALDQTINGESSLSRWWFLRKHPHWRIRLLDADTAMVRRLLDKLVMCGVIANWQPVLYEAETAAFGGPSGMSIAHELFCADSRCVLNYVRDSAPQAGRRELSIVLINAMMTAAGLDWFERGDVFSRVARLRPEPPADTADRMGKLAAQLRLLVTNPAWVLLVDSGPPNGARPWLSAFENAGRQFGSAADQHLLTRGTRAILAQAVIFHWNRLDLPAASQGILARAATAVYLS